MNFNNAFRGLRNPLESWAKSDSKFGLSTPQSDLALDVAALYCRKEGISPLDGDHYDITESEFATWLRKNGIIRIDDSTGAYYEYAYLGPNDLDLAHRMIKAGSSDRKFLRQIFVSVDITAPLYWY